MGVYLKERRLYMYVKYCENKPKSEFIVSEYIDWFEVFNAYIFIVLFCVFVCLCVCLCVGLCVCFCVCLFVCWFAILFTFIQLFYFLWQQESKFWTNNTKLFSTIFCSKFIQSKVRVNFDCVNVT